MTELHFVFVALALGINLASNGTNKHLDQPEALPSLTISGTFNTSTAYGRTALIAARTLVGVGPPASMIGSGKCGVLGVLGARAP